MQSLKVTYKNILNELDNGSKRSALLCLVGCALVYFVVLIFRISLAGRWDNPELWVAGERILATHDAYYWLARAKMGVDLHLVPFAYATQWFHDITGFALGDIAFWGPAILASGVGVASFLWGYLLGGRTAGLFAGVAGALTPGFFYRSRLGYFDTDLVTLFGPILISLLLAYYLADKVKTGWFVSDDSHVKERSYLTDLSIAFVAGLLTRSVNIFHFDIQNVSVWFLLLAALLLAVNGRSSKRGLGMIGLSVFVLAAYPGAVYGMLGRNFLYVFPVGFKSLVYFSIALAAIFIAAVHFYGHRITNLIESFWGTALFFVCVLLVTGVLQFSILSGLNKVGIYILGGAAGSGGDQAAIGPVYPSILKSVIEVKRVALSVILERGAFSAWIGVLALLAGVVVTVVRPIALLLLPMVALHMLSIKLGARFTMFGGVGLMVFIGVMLDFICRYSFRHFKRQELYSFGAQLVPIIILCATIYPAYAALPLTPVIPQGHAEALIELGEKAPKDSRTWTWWDWGYATQYFAGLSTVVDGGRHAGRDVFPVAFALSSHNPQNASGMIKYSAHYPATGKNNMGLSPADAWDQMPRNGIMSAVEKDILATEAPAHPQYLVVTWKDLTILKWVSFYGNWNLETGQTKEAVINNFMPGELGIDIRRGAVANRNGRGGLVEDVTVLSDGDVMTNEYFMNSVSPQLLPERRHLVINKTSGQSLLMDRTGYRSMAMRLLAADPADPEIRPYFKLVVDKLPFARIYEVVQ